MTLIKVTLVRVTLLSKLSRQFIIIRVAYGSDRRTRGYRVKLLRGWPMEDAPECSL